MYITLSFLFVFFLLLFLLLYIVLPEMNIKIDEQNSYTRYAKMIYSVSPQIYVSLDDLKSILAEILKVGDIQNAKCIILRSNDGTNVEKERKGASQ